MCDKFSTHAMCSTFSHTTDKIERFLATKFIPLKFHLALEGIVFEVQLLLFILRRASAKESN